MRGLYAIVDLEALSACGLDPLTFSAAVLAARPAALQLRAKELSRREVILMLRALSPLCRAAQVPLIANDWAELAAAAGCALVHVGQDDRSVDEVRRLAPGLGIGVSTHTLDQLAAALRSRPAYVAYGPVFATTSKDDADPVVGIDGLREAHALAKAAKVPLVAIGGITLARAPEVAPIADSAAVISALLPTVAGDLEEVTSRARALHTVFLGGAAPVELRV